MKLAMRSSRTLLAGIGTTGSLIAAVAAGALVVTGLVAFSAWPGDPLRPASPEVRLADPAPAGALGAASATPAVAPAAPGAVAAPVPARSDRFPPVPRDGVDGGAGSGRAVVPGSGVAGAFVTQTTTTPTALEPLAGATGSAGETVSAGSAAAAATSEQLAPGSGEPVQQAGQTTGAGLAAAGSEAAEFVRGFLPPPHV